MGIYRRALVNLLLAFTLEYRTHPDKAEYAQARLDLLQELRREGLVEDDEEPTRNIERHARKTLINIEQEARIMLPV
jgi:hypothetical protein